MSTMVIIIMSHPGSEKRCKGQEDGMGESVKQNHLTSTSLIRMSVESQAFYCLHH